MKRFSMRLDETQVARGSLVCVGLDPDPARMPVASVSEFNRAIVDATAEQVCAFKLQMACYEALGSAGIEALEETVRYIRSRSPWALIIGDGKRGDIGPIAAAYARAMFETWDFDAVTVNPYQGADTIGPFLEYEGRGVFIVCRTSNPSATEFQDLLLQGSGAGVPLPLYRHVAKAAERWGASGNVGIVVGATAPGEMRALRREHPRMPFLVPGIGEQGGDAAAALEAGTDANGRGIVVNSSRGVIFASQDPGRFAEAAGEAATRLRESFRPACAVT